MSGSDDGTIKLFELGSFKCVKVITNLEGHKDAVTVSCFMKMYGFS